METSEISHLQDVLCITALSVYSTGTPKTEKTLALRLIDYGLGVLVDLSAVDIDKEVPGIPVL